MDEMKIARESKKKVTAVAFAECFTIMLSTAQRYPTNALADIAIPERNMAKYVNLSVLLIRSAQPISKWSEAPQMVMNHLPCLSLILGTIMLPITQPKKKTEPKYPNVCFGAHSRLNFCTQFLRDLSLE